MKGRRGGEPRKRTRLKVIRFGILAAVPGSSPLQVTDRLDNEGHTLGTRFHASHPGAFFVTKPTYTPGTPAPKSGIYQQVGPRGGQTTQQADSTRGKPLPPTGKPGSTWELVKPAHHKSEK